MARCSTMSGCYEWFMAHNKLSGAGQWVITHHMHKPPNTITKKSCTQCLLPSQESDTLSGASWTAWLRGETGGSRRQRDRKVMKDGWRRSARGPLLSLCVAVAISWHMQPCFTGDEGAEAAWKLK